MPFLIAQELKSVIREYKVNHIADNDPANITVAINTAITEVASRLVSKNDRSKNDGRLKIDTKAVFTQEGDDRNPLILELTKIVTLWWLLPRSNAGVDWEVVRDRYSAAIDYIKDLATGEANDMTLPTIEDPTDEDGNPISSTKPFRMGSRAKFNHE
ncbi:hypothetical protein KO02_17505 [Sphingobacterium sp. ML3W]|uniref:hypothetical protein n=1 Tax=Sphingobacterium sp. ML3W TaxID=1538644 RepID=UPI0004F598DF|nr:hypothetical protein [Sphingobacterium sp. ML3W]AIM38280.1 hypothetical protein KO02_17505 [Sphingobacterium sp. ML3W]